MENINLIDNQLERIYLQGYIPRKGKKLFNNLAIIYEMSMKSLETYDSFYNNEYVRFDEINTILEFSLLNYSMFQKILSFIISNPSSTMLYDIDLVNLVIIIKFKNIKKFVKFYNMSDIPIIEGK